MPDRINKRQEEKQGRGKEFFIFADWNDDYPRLSPIIIPLRATNLRADNNVTVIQSTRARVRWRKVSGIGSISRHFLHLILARVLGHRCHSPASTMPCYRVCLRCSPTRTQPAITSSSAWLTLIGVPCRNAVTPLSLPTARDWYCITPSWSFIVGPFPGLGSTIGRGQRGAELRAASGERMNRNPATLENVTLSWPIRWFINLALLRFAQKRTRHRSSVDCTRNEWVLEIIVAIEISFLDNRVMVLHLYFKMTAKIVIIHNIRIGNI